MHISIIKSTEKNFFLQKMPDFYQFLPIYFDYFKK